MDHHSNLPVDPIDNSQTGAQSSSDNLNSNVKAPEVPENLNTSSSPLPPLPDHNFYKLSLKSVIQRTMADAFQSFKKTTKKMKSASKAAKRELIMRSVFRCQNVIRKSLVATKFVQREEAYVKSMKIITHCQNENLKIKSAHTALVNNFSDLNSARTVKYDVPTAVDIFETGSMRMFPTIIKDSLAEKPELSKREIMATFDIIDNHIFDRVVNIDFVPSPIQKEIRIDDGKLYLKCENEYEVCLTLLGIEKDLPWHLVSFKLLVKDNEVDNSKDPTKMLSDLQYRHITYTIQQHLLPQRLKDKPVYKEDAPEEFNEAGIHISDQLLPNGRTPYLTHLHKYAHNLCVDLQWEILYSQAFKLQNTKMIGLINTQTNTTHTIMVIHYWSDTKPLVFKSPGISKKKACIIIEKDNEAEEKKLKVKWDSSLVQDLIVDFDKEQLDRITPSELELYVNPSELNVEHLINQVVRIHSKLLLIKLENILLNTSNHSQTIFAKQLTSKEIRLVETKNPHLEIKYANSRSLKIGIDPRNGRPIVRLFDLKRETIRLNDVENSILRFPHKVSDILLRWRLEKVMDDFIFLGTFHKQITNEELYLNPTEMVKFGTPLKRVLYFRNNDIIGRYLCIVLVGFEIKFFYINVKQVGHFFQFTKLTNFDDIIKRFFKKVDYYDFTEFVYDYLDHKHDPKSDLLGGLIEISKAYHLIGIVDEQAASLSLRNITKYPAFPMLYDGIDNYYPRDDIPPCLQNMDFSGLFSIMFSYNEKKVVRLFKICKNEISSLLKLNIDIVKSDINVFASPNFSNWMAYSFEVDYDFFEGCPHLKMINRWILEKKDVLLPDGKVITRGFFTILVNNLQTSLYSFCIEFRAFITAVNFYIESQVNNLTSLNMQVIEYNLESITIKYHDYFSLTTGWGYENGSLFRDKESKLRILLHSNHPDGTRNPHIRIQTYLEAFLNDTLSLFDTLKVIQQTLTALMCLDSYEKRMLRGVNIVPKSHSVYRLYFSKSCSVELSIINSSYIRITDGSLTVVPDRAPPAPWRPNRNRKKLNEKNKVDDQSKDNEASKGKKSESELQRGAIDPYNPMQIYPTKIPYFPVFASILGYSLRQKLNSNIPEVFPHTNTSITISHSLLSAALHTLDWFYTLHSVFHHAFVVGYNNQGTPSFDRPEHFEFRHSTMTADWIMKTQNLMSEIIFDPVTLKPQQPLPNGKILTMDILKRIGSFLTKRINIANQQIIGNFNSSFVATHLSPELLLDFHEIIHLIEDKPTYANKEVMIDWAMSAPINPPNLLPTGVKPYSQTFSINVKEGYLKCLFFVERDGVTLTLPLVYRFNNKHLQTWLSLDSEQNLYNHLVRLAESQYIEYVKFDALETALTQFNNLDISDPLRISYFFKWLHTIDSTSFQNLIPTTVKVEPEVKEIVEEESSGPQDPGLQTLEKMED